MDAHTAVPPSDTSKQPRTSGRRLLSRLPQRSSQGERAISIASAGAMFVGVFGLGVLIEEHAAEAVAVLYTLPIALVAIEFGTPGGLAAATCGIALFALVTVVTRTNSVAWSAT